MRRRQLRFATSQLLLTALLLCALLVSPLTAAAQTVTPPPAYAQSVAALIKEMTVDQKVGQLFLIDFPGIDTSASSDIADLITNYHVGGVRLKASNQNIGNGITGTRDLADLTNELQVLAAITETQATAATTATTSVATTSLPAGAGFIPLFVAMAQEGDGAPYSELTQGVTASPSQLALGATWQPDYAGIVGQIEGKSFPPWG